MSHSTLVERAAKQPLSAEAMADAMDRIMTQAMSTDEMSGFLQALASRGETAEEIAAAVQSLRRHAVRLPLAQPFELCDTCGTGGDGQGTFNISTLAALVAAACGVRVAKHGNRAASSRCGSADVLQALGLNLEADPACVARSIERLGFGFCFAPLFHPAMKAVAPVRKALGIRTIFNLIGPLANPAALTFQLVGVSEERLMRPVAEALRTLGIRHGLVVHGADGLDEVTLTGDTRCLELRDGALKPLTIRPEDVALPRITLEQLRGGDPAQNARIATNVLEGPASPHQDVVALNAGCAIYVADRAPDIREGVAQAREAIRSGRARMLLRDVMAHSQGRAA